MIVKTVDLTPVTVAAPTRICSQVAGGMLDFTRIFGRHEIDIWRDEQTLSAAVVLNQLAADLACDFEKELEGATWKDGLIAPSRFIATRVAPTVRQVSEPIIEKIIDRANRDLQRIVQHQAVWNETAGNATEVDETAAALHDVAFAAAPLAGGLAAAAAVPVMGITTTTAFFGLVTTTAISWPVVVVGGAVAGAGIATGVLNTSRIWAKAESRLRNRIHSHVVATLVQGRPNKPSILEQLSALFARTAVQAKKL
jgi:hypothetical protein